MFKQKNPCSNHEIQVPFEHGFGRRHWSMRRDVTVIHRNKMADVEEAPRFSVSFDVANVNFKKF